MSTHVIPVIVQLSMAALLILTAAAVLTSTVFRRASAAARHLAWTAATVAVLLLPAFALLPTPEAMPDELTPMPRLAASLPPLPVLEPAAVTGVTESPTPRRQISWPAAIAVAYGVVLLGWLTPLLLSPVLFARLKRRSVPAGDTSVLAVLDTCRRTLGISRATPLLMSADARTMPLTFGMIRPHVLLPGDAASWSKDKLRLVLSHELAHIKRHDCLTLYLAQLVRAIHWFNPLAHLAVRRMFAERERACDDLVLATTSARPSEYADTLLNLTASLRPAPQLLPVMPMARASHLHTRLLAILDPRHNRSPLTRRLTVAVLLMAPVVALPLACTPAAKSPDQTLAAAAAAKKTGREAAALPKGWTEETIRCASQLRQIGQYILLYANEHELRLPPDLGSTFRFADGATDAERAGRYLEPRDRTAIPDGVTGVWIDAHTSYKYLGTDGVRLPDLPGTDRTILAHDSPSRAHKHAEQGAVISALYADGHVELLPLVEARKQIAESEQVLKKLAAAGAKGGVEKKGQAQGRPAFGKPVPFEIGDVSFLPGDSITVERVLQEAAATNGQEGGGIFTVSGTYTLSSRDSAVLGLFITSPHQMSGVGSSTHVMKGTGAFTLRYAQTGLGHPHVSFYPDGAGGSSFGGVYFGSGTTLLKHK